MLDLYTGRKRHEVQGVQVVLESLVPPRNNPVVFLNGSRQSDKSTLAQALACSFVISWGLAPYPKIACSRYCPLPCS